MTKDRSLHDELVDLADRVEAAKSEREELSMYYAVPVEALRQPGLSQKCKAEGTARGHPNVTLLTPKGPYSGLLLCVKAKNNPATKEQAEWCSKLTIQGFLALICVGADEAWSIINDYLNQRG